MTAKGEGGTTNEREERGKGKREPGSVDQAEELHGRVSLGRGGREVRR